MGFARARRPPANESFWVPKAEKGFLSADIGWIIIRIRDNINKCLWLKQNGFLILKIVLSW